MTSVQCPSPSAPIFTNLKIQATRPPQSKNRREKYPFGAPTPNLEPVPDAMTNRIDEAKAAVVEALKLNPKLTVKNITERYPKTPAVAEGLRRAGLREQ